MEKLCQPRSRGDVRAQSCLRGLLPSRVWQRCQERAGAAQKVGCGRGGGGAPPAETRTSLVFTVHLPGGLAALWGRCGGLQFATAATWAWLSCIYFELQLCARF